MLAGVPNYDKNTSVNLLFKWNKSLNADKYRFQLSKDSAFTNIVVNDSTLRDTVKQVNNLTNSTKYYWRVQGLNAIGDGLWSDVWQFTTIIAVPSVPAALLPTSNAVNQEIKLTLRWTTTQRAEQYHLQLSKDQGFTSVVVNDSTLSDTLKTVDLNNDSKYYWRVRAKNTGGLSLWSEVRQFSTIIAKPEIPALVYPANNAINVSADLTLRWNKSNRTEKYIVELSNDSTFSNAALDDSSVADTLKRVAPLVYDMKYYWRVKASNIGGESSWSEKRTFKTVIAAPDFPYLYSPVNNALNQATDVKVKWQRLKNAENYQLQVSAFQDFRSFVINDSTLTDSIKQVSGLKNNTVYYWRVRAGNIGGYGAWSEVWNLKTIVAIPSVPVLLNPANGSKNLPSELKLSWNPVQDAEIYIMNLSEDSLFTKPVAVDSMITLTSKDITGLKNGMKYYWWVRAKNIAGTSSYSITWSFTTLLPTPVSLSAAADGLRKVKLTWADKSDGESGFILERMGASEAGYKIIDTLKANTASYIDSTVQLSTTYKYRLRAYTPHASSEYSNEASVTTLTSVADLKTVVKENALMQNYPNPFNPSTVIAYSLLTESKVRVTVYNSLGQLVSELVNGIQSGGSYAEVFDAGSLPSGIYIYTITAQTTDGKNNFSSVKKMLLVK